MRRTEEKLVEKLLSAKKGEISPQEITKIADKTIKASLVNKDYIMVKKIIMQTIKLLKN